MGGLFGRIVGLDDLRKELRERTDTLKLSSEKWVVAANDLTKADKELTKALREHKQTVVQFIDLLGKL